METIKGALITGSFMATEGIGNPRSQQPLKSDEVAELAAAIEEYTKGDSEYTVGQMVYSVFNQFIIIPKHKYITKNNVESNQSSE
jgi:hypothetical protein